MMVRGAPVPPPLLPLQLRWAHTHTHLTPPPPSLFTSPSPSPGYALPKIYSKNYYCVSCAVHSRIVRVRNVFKRRDREPPVRFKKTPEKSKP
jgi:hypothetical protein